MAVYSTSVRTPLSTSDAFARVADVSRFQEWDPGVSKSVRVVGEGNGVGTVYALTIGGSSPQVFRYEVMEFDEGKRLLMIAKTKRFTSVDEISVASDERGTVVRYHAELTLNGALRIFDLPLRFVFNRIGDRAAKGLAKFMAVR
jgi:hypothetical protein